MKRIIFAVITLAAVNLVWAEDTTPAPQTKDKLTEKAEVETVSVMSQGFYQAKQDQLAVTAGVNHKSQDGKMIDGKELSEIGPMYQMKAEYGWTKNYASELVLEYQDATAVVGDFEIEKSGLADLRLTLKGQKTLSEDSTLNYGAHIKRSLGDKETDVTVLGKYPNFTGVDIESTTARTGGTSITPYIGYQARMADGVGGARLTQSIWGAEREVRYNYSFKRFDQLDPSGTSPAVNQTERGGGLTEAQVFYEQALSDTFELGTNFKYKWYSEVERQPKGAKFDQYRSAIQMAVLGFYPTWNINKNAAILGSVSYSSLITKDITYNDRKLDDGSITDVTLTGRFTF